MNDKRVVGYTIHEIINELDGGDIFYQYNYEIKNGKLIIRQKIN